MTTLAETLAAQLKNVGTDATNANLASVRDAAVRTVATTLLDLTASAIKSKLPVDLAAKAETDLGKVVVGNLLAAGLRQMGSGSPFFQQLAQEVLSSHVTRLAAPAGEAVTAALDPSAPDVSAESPRIS